MANCDVEVVIVGGGAAGIAACRRLHEARVPCLLVEARARLGGRAWTVIDSSGHALDLGCGWLHSADRNPWSGIAEAQGRAIDRTPPPWTRPSMTAGFALPEQREFFRAMDAFHTRMESVENSPDRPAADLLDPGGRWNDLIVTVNTFVTGAEIDRVSAWDMARYDDTGVNWRVVEGLGATIAAHGDGLPVALDCRVLCIDHGGTRLRIETDKGAIAADRAVVTLPTPMLADEDFFAPRLPHKAEAAGALPLGFDDKLFLRLRGADKHETDCRLFGRTNRAGTGAYHLRPFGRPLIEAYFGGSLAAELEVAGGEAFFDFAVAELVALLGSAFARRMTPIRVHRWGADPFARGAYSYAKPGKAGCRQILATPVDDRLYFAGEACVRNDYSTAHGGWLSGTAAADQVIAARR
ncbi:MAG: NAD(P)/FAD-dependent oxidoreductase [Xanthobacteraceae bacterium]